MPTRLVFPAILMVGMISLSGCGQATRIAENAAPRTDATPRKEVPPDDAPQMKFRAFASREQQRDDAESAPAMRMSSESYEHSPESRMVSVRQQPVSTFSIDVDTASYSNVRRFLRERRLPPPDAVRIEELINYFSYDDPPADGATPFSVNVEVASCPWNNGHRLTRIGLKGKTMTSRERPASNLVFLIDVSGSMNHPKKLPLVKQSIGLLVEQLDKSDRIAIVVYAGGAAGLVLPSTSAANKTEILNAIDRLQSGGSTNGALGIGLGYDVARQNFIPKGTNRVVLCTDGDFNVGPTSQRELQQLIEEHAKSGVYLTVLGFGMGNLKDATMERLADHGNGNYGYIDNIAEARKLFVEQLAGTLVTIAKDVKIQVEFNPAQVAAYRLVGYEDRRLANRDFQDDTKDAGEIRAGHSVTALYELIPAGLAVDFPSPDPLRYQPVNGGDVEPRKDAADASSDELLAVRLRYKEPDGQKSRLHEVAVVDRGTDFAAASADFRFAAAVAQFGMMLTNSRFCGDTTYDKIAQAARAAIASDPNGHRNEFLELVALARDLSNELRLLSRHDGEK